jgi:hypothetical protein
MNYFGPTLLGRSVKHDPLTLGHVALQNLTILGSFDKHDPMMRAYTGTQLVMLPCRT